MSVEDLDPSECMVATAEAGYDFYLYSYDDPAGMWTLADAALAIDTYVWSGLPYGTYGLMESVPPFGYSTYFIPGSAAVGGSADEGYEVTLDPSAPSITIDVYNVGLEGVS